jgi:hypothetical protein
MPRLDDRPPSEREMLVRVTNELTLAIAFLDAGDTASTNRLLSLAIDDLDFVQALRSAEVDHVPMA